MLTQPTISWEYAGVQTLTAGQGDKAHKGCCLPALCSRYPQGDDLETAMTAPEYGLDNVSNAAVASLMQATAGVRMLPQLWRSVAQSGNTTVGLVMAVYR